MSDSPTLFERPDPAIRCERAVLPSTGDTIYVMAESGHGLHREGTAWLRSMQDIGRSPNTVRNYGIRVAWYLSWAALSGYDWRSPSITMLASWKNTLLTSPYLKRGKETFRKADTVDRWLIATTEFYKWAAANGHVDKTLVDSFFEERYLPPGPRGGETGRTVKVKIDEVSSRGSTSTQPIEWLESPEQRQAILDLPLPPRNRFLVDLLYATGIRGGEALSLFRENLHFLQDNTALNCRLPGPHIHVKRNKTLNSARAKLSMRRGAMSRYVPVPADVVISYENYRFERMETLGADDNPHVFVNLYSGVLGGAYTTDSLESLFQSISKKVGFYVRPHMLRHTRATLWIRGIEGPRLDVDTVQELLGHVSAQSTMIYVHRSDQDLRRAVEGVSLRMKSTDNTGATS